MLRIGMIGCGGIAYPHVDGWLAIKDEAQITALNDIDPQNRQKMADKVGTKVEHFDDFKELISSKSVDAVDICLPHHLHRDAIVAAAEAGVHVLCEKPLCTTLDEAKDIEAAIKKNGITLMCAHNQLFDPAVRAAKQAANEGRIGKIYHVRTCDCFMITDRPTVDHWGWRAKLATAGGGCLIDTGYHPSYLLLFLATAPAVEVSALTMHHSTNPIEGEDTAQLLVRFADETSGYLITSWGHDVPMGTWQFHLVGEKGQIYGRGNDLYIHPRGQSAEKIQVAGGHSFHAEVAHFADSVIHQTRPIQTEKDGIDVLKLILGAYQSEKEKRTIAL